MSDLGDSSKTECYSALVIPHVPRKLEAFVFPGAQACY